jgi:hypothetical protein
MCMQEIGITVVEGTRTDAYMWHVKPHAHKSGAPPLHLPLAPSSTHHTREIAKELERINS